MWLVHAGKTLWLVVDGAYAKRPFLRPVMARGVVVFSRLRKDANLRSLPPTERRRGQRGPLPTYGKDKIERLAAVLLHRPGDDGGGDPGGHGRSRRHRTDLQGCQGSGGRGPAAGAQSLCQQQVRNLYASIGAFAVNLTLYSVVEAWAWPRRQEALVDRSRSPWDAQERRPSHTDKRKALQREILQEEIRTLVPKRRKRRQFQNLVLQLLDLAS